MKIDELSEIAWHLRNTAKNADRLCSDFEATIRERDKLKRKVVAYETVLANITPESREKFERLLFIVEKGLPFYSVDRQFAEIQL